MLSLLIRKVGQGRQRGLFAAALMCMLMAAPSASAHPQLLQSVPAPGVLMQESPKAIVLSFTESIESSGSALLVQRLDGRRVDLGSLSTGARGGRLTATLGEALAGGVYRLKWSVLGADGHQVGGTFSFGVLEPGGAPPRGVEHLGAAAGAGNLAGTSSRKSDGIVTVIARWAGLLAAALMLGGWLLARSARARGLEVPPFGQLAMWVWAIGMAAALQSVILVAGSGPATGLDAGLLTSTDAGVFALLRVCVLAVLGAAALRLRRPALFGPAGALVLATYALSGHTATVTEGRMLARLESLVHVEAAGVWVGGLLSLALWAWRGDVPARSIARAFAPVAQIAVALLAITGVLLAIREVDSWLFLRWSTYGHLVVVKTVLFVSALALATRMWWRWRASDREPPEVLPGRSSPLALRSEMVLAIVVVALAATLAGLTPGRGQLEYAQRGSLLTGAALATAATADGPLQITVAPARAGDNMISAIPVALREEDPVTRPRSITVRLVCDCPQRDQRSVTLRQTAEGVWSARVQLPREARWFAYPRVGGQPATTPVSLAIVEPHDGGPTPFVVRATADLSGAAAEHCRAFVQGLAMGIARLNARGGVDGGRKVALDVRDDGGDPTRAAQLARVGDPHVLAPCGSAGETAVRATGDALVLVADPVTPPTEAAHVFRLALDPRAEGVGIGRFLEHIPLRNSAGAPKHVGVVVRDAAGRERLAGLRAALAPRGVTVASLPGDTAESTLSLARAVDPKRYIATLLDGDPVRVAAALRALGRGDGHVSTSTMFATPAMATERFILNAGSLGRLGAVSTPSETVWDSVDGQTYVKLVGAVFRGDRPRLAGLRGYVTGLTLAEAVHDGTDLSDMVSRLRRPRQYTDALTIPWREDAPTRGTRGSLIYTPNFLTANLLPESAGGMTNSGGFFQKGTWARATPLVYGPDLQIPATNVATGNEAPPLVAGTPRTDD